MSVSPNPAVPHQSVTITSTGFTLASVPGGTGANGVHRITGTGTSLITVGGMPVNAPNVTYPIDLDSGGNLLATIILPINSTVLAATALGVRVTDQQGVTASASLGLVQRELTLEPHTSERGSAVRATGKGFPANNPVSIDYAGVAVVTTIPTANGAFEATFTVPVTADIPSTNRVTATTTGYAATASVNHSVPGVSLTISPTQAAAGSTITVVGKHFPGFSTVNALIIGPFSVLPLPAPNTDRDGNFTASVLVPELTASTWTLTATVGGIQSLTSIIITQ